jgi:hypothetical protein
MPTSFSNSRRMIQAGYVARMGEKKNAYRVLVGNPERKRPLEDLDVDGRTLLRFILEKLDRGMD